jgi:polyisoprenoid-binding protein YceI
MHRIATLCAAVFMLIPQSALAEKFALDRDASHLWFIGTKNSAVAVTGSFATLSGELDTDSRSGFIEVQIRSLATGDEARDANITTHLFGAAEHPTARFVVSGVSGAEALPPLGQSAEVQVSGTLQLRGRSIELTLALRLSSERGPDGTPRLRLQTRGPAILTREQLGLEQAFAALQAVCGHAALSGAVPIQLDLLFAPAR